MGWGEGVGRGVAGITRSCMSPLLVQNIDESVTASEKEKTKCKVRGGEERTW